MNSADENDKKQHQNKTSRRTESETQHRVELTVDSTRFPRYVLIFCVVAEITFVVLDYHLNYGRLVHTGAIRRLFSTVNENGLAGWFGATQTFMAALTLWLIYFLVKRQPGSRWKALGWLVLALFLTYLAIDDGTELHERVGTAMGVEQAHPLISFQATLGTLFSYPCSARWVYSCLFSCGGS